MMVEVRFVRVWVNWENVLVLVESNGWIGEVFGEYVCVFVCLENYYFYNDGFLIVEMQILNCMDWIVYILGFIVQGWFDMICLLKVVYQFYKNWFVLWLMMVLMVGYVLLELGILCEFVCIMDNYGFG